MAPNIALNRRLRSRLHCPRNETIVSWEDAMRTHTRHFALTCGSLACLGLLPVAASRRRPTWCASIKPIAAATMSTSSTPPPTRPSAISKGIEAAHGVTGSPDGSKVYISNESESTLDVFDAQDLQADQRRSSSAAIPTTSRSPRTAASSSRSRAIPARSRSSTATR